MEGWQNLAYAAAAVLFVVGVKMLGRAETAKRGNQVSAVGMLVAVVATLVSGGFDLRWVALGLVAGGLVGFLAARRVQMTQMPEMVALLNGSGGLASVLVGMVEFLRTPDMDPVRSLSVVLALFIGSICVTGSLVAFGKLSGRLSGAPTLFAGQKAINAVLLVIVALAALPVVLDGALASGAPLALLGLYLILVLSLLLGVLGVLPIGGADMPIVISLLNSSTGMAVAASGFILDNTVLVVSGALVGASGLILTQVMCKAMNRSLANVLFGGFGAKVSSAAITGEIKPLVPEDAYFILEAANSVLFVPGYGMAVAQAQHAVKELADQLEQRGTEVRYAIHPVAGRMPGHMNVLLAEANVPYEQLVEPDDVNPTMETVDVAVVIGANDVVNPAAKTDPGSPLYGMPIIEVDRAKTTLVLKRSMSPGFSGVDNGLFTLDASRMVFGDAKAVITAITAAFKED